MTKLATALALILSLPLNAQSPQEKKILLPVVIQRPVHGAFGSLWNTEVDLYYAGSQPLRVVGVDLFCPLPEGGCQNPLNPRVEYRNAPVQVATDTPGAFLVIPAAADRDLSVHLRVFDSSRSATNRGTEVPAIRDSEAWTTPMQLLDVPASPPFRTLLRIYDFDPAAGHTVQVNVYDESGRVLETRSVVLRQPAIIAFPASVLLPGYADLDLSQLGNVGTDVRVEVIPLSTGLRFWAMASTTNNDTQHVTLTTP